MIDERTQPSSAGTGRGAPTRVAFALVGVLVLVTAAVPAASALDWGINASGASEAIKAGTKPKYGLLWVTEDTIQGGKLGATDAALASAKSQGVIPVVQWYYWGNSISPSCVKYGCDGKSTGEWSWMAKSLAQHVRGKLGSFPAVIVIETEFNKNGIQHWAGFDDKLVAQIKIFEQYAPNAKIVIGFGAWGTVETNRNFADATWRADYAGFQLLRSSYRYSDGTYLNAADDALASAKRLRQAFPGKPLFMTDLALSSWDGGEWLQKAALAKFFLKEGEFDRLGVKAIVYRWAKDFSSASTKDYHGPAEKYWGLKRFDGSPKAAWWVWVKGAK